VFTGGRGIGGGVSSRGTLWDGMDRYKIMVCEAYRERSSRSLADSRCCRCLTFAMYFETPTLVYGLVKM
jgi:hypothetical protein